MTWTIRYLDSRKRSASVELWLDSLSDAQLKFIAKEIQLLQHCGNTLRLPHSKSLGKGLFELRERKYGYRIYYSFSANKTIILLHAGDKTSQKTDIKIARERLKMLD